MITNKYIDKIIIGVVIISILFTSVLFYAVHDSKTAVEASTSKVAMSYETEVFNKDEVMTVNIQIDEDQWQELLDHATDEEYVSADVTVNGITYYNVGIRCKGNTSLTQVASSDTTDRYSFKIKFDEYVDNQTCQGLDKLALNNIIQDGTYMKEYMSYDLMNAIGVTTPLYSFSNITVNGQEWGLYLAVESLSESFAKRTYGTDYGALYKVESDNMGGAKNGELPEEGKSMADSSMNSNSGGADLVYTDDELESYSDILNNPSYDVTDEEKTELIQAIKNLNEGVELEKYVDVDQTLRYIAANTVLVNLDSYFSNMKHNYYIYEENGQITPIPWDYNLSFAGFQSGDSTSAINFPIDTPVSGVELSERPLISKLFEKEEYLNQYHEYLQEIVSSYFDSGVFENRIHYLDGLIGEYVKNDPSAFYTYDEYQIAITELKEFGTLRALSIQGQLNHTIPSTTEGQQEDSSSLIDGSSVDISAMGTQGGDSMGEPSSRGTPGGQGENQLPEGMSPGGQEGNQLPEGMSPGGQGVDQLPEGMSPGGQGENELPEGMPPGGQGENQLPEGMSPEGQGENQLPEGMPPGGQEEDLSNEGASDLQDAVPAGNMFKDQEMEFGQDSRKNMQFNVSSQKMSMEHVIYMVILVAVLAVMTLVAKFWKRRKVC